MDMMEIDDDAYINRDLVNQDFHRRSRPSRCLTVGLGLLCALSLAGNIGQIIFYEIISHHASTQVSYDALTQDKDHLHSDNATMGEERDELQSRFDALATEKKQLQIFLSNLTEEKDRLKQSVNSVTAERDELKASLNNVKNETDQLQASYDALRRESDQLQKSYNDTRASLDELQADHKNLIGSRDQLQTKSSSLQREKNELQTLYFALVAKRDQLESNYSSLKRDKDQLDRSYNILSLRKNNTDTSYRMLWQDNNQVKSRYYSLRNEMDELQRRYSSLATDRDQLRKNVDKMTAKIKGTRCQDHWRKFDMSCYFLSTAKKNWTESREACITEGADLIVIDSIDEQVFVNGILEQGHNAWIGLTDSVIEGVWTWVDDTPVNITYWQPGQPNSYNGNQDCGEFVQDSSGSVGQWNDDGCFAEQIWICEK